MGREGEGWRERVRDGERGRQSGRERARDYIPTDPCYRIKSAPPSKQIPTRCDGG